VEGCGRQRMAKTDLTQKPKTGTLSRIQASVPVGNYYQ
jgi:hypothetical protein